MVLGEREMKEYKHEDAIGDLKFLKEQVKEMLEYVDTTIKLHKEGLPE